VLEELTRVPSLLFTLYYSQNDMEMTMITSAFYMANRHRDHHLYGEKRDIYAIVIHCH